jgi:putative ABC transport system permease protein
MSAYKLNAFNSISVALNDAGSFASFRQTVVRDTRSAADARTEEEYLEEASSWVNRMLRIVAYSIGAIMALGALFSALNSMYSAVAARATETATLRAIGFSGSAVAVAVMIEALLLALLGAAIGVSPRTPMAMTSRRSTRIGPPSIGRGRFRRSLSASTRSERDSTTHSRLGFARR